MKKIIILRGNSGSEKTTVARALQKKFGYNTMMISQDEITICIFYLIIFLQHYFRNFAK